MSLIAATVISVKDNLPYFLVSSDEQGYRFFTTKVHRHDHETSLGAILKGFKELGPVNLSEWRLGELTSVEQDGVLMSLYSFEVTDMEKVEKSLNHQLKFIPADHLHHLLEALETTSFVSFEE